MAPKLAVIVRYLVKGNSFPVCFRLVDVVSVPKEAFTDIGGYRPVSIIPVLSKVTINYSITQLGG